MSQRVSKTIFEFENEVRDVMSVTCSLRKVSSKINQPLKQNFKMMHFGPGRVIGVAGTLFFVELDYFEAICKTELYENQPS